MIEARLFLVSIIDLVEVRLGLGGSEELCTFQMLEEVAYLVG